MTCECLIPNCGGPDFQQIGQIYTCVKLLECGVDMLETVSERRLHIDNCE